MVAPRKPRHGEVWLTKSGFKLAMIGEEEARDEHIDAISCLRVLTPAICSILKIEPDDDYEQYHYNQWSWCGYYGDGGRFTHREGDDAWDLVELLGDATLEEYKVDWRVNAPG